MFLSFLTIILIPVYFVCSSTFSSIQLPVVCIFSYSDLECTYTIICSIVKKVTSPEEVLEVVKAIASKVAQQPSDKASLRLKMYESL